MVATPITAEEYEEMQQIAREHCKHRDHGVDLFVQHTADGKPYHPNVGGEPVAWRCVRCGEYASLGPSDEHASEQVEQEIRAAELAAAWKPVGGVRRIIKPDEHEGWSGWPYRQPESDGEWTGFLAAQIRNHERDLGDVNWAGHHMADHEVPR